MRWLLVLSISVAATARAHDADVIYAFVQQYDDASTVVVEHLTMTDATLRLLVPVDIDHDGAISADELQEKATAIRVGVWEDAPLSAGEKTCTLNETDAQLREGFVELIARFNCGDGELRQDFRILRVLPANYRVVLGSQLEGERSGRGVAQGSLSALRIPRPPSKYAWNENAFSSGFDAGLSRGFAVDALALVACLMFSLAAWRRGLQGLGFLVAGLLLGSFVEEYASTGLLMAFTGAACVALRPMPIFAAILGAGIGVRAGGDVWSRALGLATGSTLVIGAAALAFLAVGVMLARRPSAKRARWIAFGIAAIAAAVVRLS